MTPNPQPLTPEALDEIERELQSGKLFLNAANINQFTALLSECRRCHALLDRAPTTPTREAMARIIYEADPYYESGEQIDGFQVTPGGNLSWKQAVEHDAEFEGDPVLLSITESAYKLANQILALFHPTSGEPSHD